MASLYLIPAIDEADTAVGATVRVTGAEARHAITVARIRVGEQVSVGDGAGLIVEGTVASTDGGELAVTVDRSQRASPPVPEIWLAQALAKGDRDERAVQTATELGVFGVIPWAAERSVSRWDGAKEQRGRDRWAAIVREASKQAIRPTIPQVAPLATTAELATREGIVLVLDPTASRALTEAPIGGTDRITLVVGPEGGVSPRELAILSDAGAHVVRLGPEVLRTSSAGPAALAVLNSRLGRW